MDQTLLHQLFLYIDWSCPTPSRLPDDQIYHILPKLVQNTEQRICQFNQFEPPLPTMKTTPPQSDFPHTSSLPYNANCPVGVNSSSSSSSSSGEQSDNHDGRKITVKHKDFGHDPMKQVETTRPQTPLTGPGFIPHTIITSITRPGYLYTWLNTPSSLTHHESFGESLLSYAFGKLNLPFVTWLSELYYSQFLLYNTTTGTFDFHQAHNHTSRFDPNSTPNHNPCPTPLPPPSHIVTMNDAFCITNRSTTALHHWVKNFHLSPAQILPLITAVLPSSHPTIPLKQLYTVQSRLTHDDLDKAENEKGNKQSTPSKTSPLTPQYNNVNEYLIFNVNLTHGELANSSILMLILSSKYSFSPHIIDLVQNLLQNSAKAIHTPRYQSVLSNITSKSSKQSRFSEYGVPSGSLRTDQIRRNVAQLIFSNIWQEFTPTLSKITILLYKRYPFDFKQGLLLNLYSYLDAELALETILTDENKRSKKKKQDSIFNPISDPSFHPFTHSPAKHHYYPYPIVVTPIYYLFSSLSHQSSVLYQSITKRQPSLQTAPAPHSPPSSPLSLQLNPTNTPSLTLFDMLAGCGIDQLNKIVYKPLYESIISSPTIVDETIQYDNPSSNTTIKHQDLNNTKNEEPNRQLATTTITRISPLHPPRKHRTPPTVGWLTYIMDQCGLFITPQPYYKVKVTHPTRNTPFFQEMSYHQPLLIIFHLLNLPHYTQTTYDIIHSIVNNALFVELMWLHGEALKSDLLFRPDNWLKSSVLLSVLPTIGVKSDDNIRVDSNNSLPPMVEPVNEGEGAQNEDPIALYKLLSNFYTLPTTLPFYPTELQSSQRLQNHRCLSCNGHMITSLQFRSVPAVDHSPNHGSSNDSYNWNNLPTGQGYVPPHYNTDINNDLGRSTTSVGLDQSTVLINRADLYQSSGSVQGMALNITNNDEHELPSGNVGEDEKGHNESLTTMATTNGDQITHTQSHCITPRLLSRNSSRTPQQQQQQQQQQQHQNPLQSSSPSLSRKGSTAIGKFCPPQLGGGQNPLQQSLGLNSSHSNLSSSSAIFDPLAQTQDRNDGDLLDQELTLFRTTNLTSTVTITNTNLASDGATFISNSVLQNKTKSGERILNRGGYGTESGNFGLGSTLSATNSSFTGYGLGQQVTSPLSTSFSFSQSFQPGVLSPIPPIQSPKMLQSRSSFAHGGGNQNLPASRQFSTRIHKIDHLAPQQTSINPVSTTLQSPLQTPRPGLLSPQFTSSPFSFSFGQNVGSNPGTPHQVDLDVYEYSTLQQQQKYQAEQDKIRMEQLALLKIRKVQKLEANRQILDKIPAFSQLLGHFHQLLDLQLIEPTQRITQLLKRHNKVLNIASGTTASGNGHDNNENIKFSYNPTTGLVTVQDPWYYYRNTLMNTIPATVCLHCGDLVFPTLPNSGKDGHLHHLGAVLGQIGQMPTYFTDVTDAEHPPTNPAGEANAKPNHVTLSLNNTPISSVPTHPTQSQYQTHQPTIHLRPITNTFLSIINLLVQTTVLISQPTSLPNYIHLFNHNYASLIPIISPSPYRLTLLKWLTAKKDLILPFPALFPHFPPFHTHLHQYITKLHNATTVEERDVCSVPDIPNTNGTLVDNTIFGSRHTSTQNQTTSSPPLFVQTIPNQAKPREKSSRFNIVGLGSDSTIQSKFVTMAINPILLPNDVETSFVLPAYLLFCNNSAQFEAILNILLDHGLDMCNTRYLMYYLVLHRTGSKEVNRDLGQMMTFPALDGVLETLFSFFVMTTIQTRLTLTMNREEHIYTLFRTLISAFRARRTTSFFNFQNYFENNCQLPQTFFNFGFLKHIVDDFGRENNDILNKIVINKQWERQLQQIKQQQQPLFNNKMQLNTSGNNSNTELTTTTHSTPHSYFNYHGVPFDNGSDSPVGIDSSLSTSPGQSKHDRSPAPSNNPININTQNSKTNTNSQQTMTQFIKRFLNLQCYIDFYTASAPVQSNPPKREDDGTNNNINPPELPPHIYIPVNTIAPNFYHADLLPLLAASDLDLSQHIVSSTPPVVPTNQSGLQRSGSSGTLLSPNQGSDAGKNATNLSGYSMTNMGYSSPQQQQQQQQLTGSTGGPSYLLLPAENLIVHRSFLKEVFQHHLFVYFVFSYQHRPTIEKSLQLFEFLRDACLLSTDLHNVFFAKFFGILKLSTHVALPSTGSSSESSVNNQDNTSTPHQPSSIPAQSTNTTVLNQSSIRPGDEDSDNTTTFYINHVSAEFFRLTIYTWLTGYKSSLIIDDYHDFIPISDQMVDELGDATKTIGGQIDAIREDGIDFDDDFGQHGSDLTKGQSQNKSTAVTSTTNLTKQQQLEQRSKRQVNLIIRQDKGLTTTLSQYGQNPNSGAPTDVVQLERYNLQLVTNLLKFKSPSLCLQTIVSSFEHSSPYFLGDLEVKLMCQMFKNLLFACHQRRDFHTFTPATMSLTLLLDRCLCINENVLELIEVCTQFVPNSSPPINSNNNTNATTNSDKADTDQMASRSNFSDGTNTSKAEQVYTSKIQFYSIDFQVKQQIPPVYTLFYHLPTTDLATVTMTKNNTQNGDHQDTYDTPTSSLSPTQQQPPPPLKFISSSAWIALLELFLHQQNPRVDDPYSRSRYRINIGNNSLLFASASTLPWLSPMSTVLNTLLNAVKVVFEPVTKRIDWIMGAGPKDNSVDDGEGMPTIHQLIESTQSNPQQLDITSHYNASPLQIETNTNAYEDIPFETAADPNPGQIDQTLESPESFQVSPQICHHPNSTCSPSTAKALHEHADLSQLLFDTTELNYSDWDESGHNPGHSNSMTQTSTTSPIPSVHNSSNNEGDLAPPQLTDLDIKILLQGQLLDIETIFQLLAYLLYPTTYAMPPSIRLDSKYASQYQLPYERLGFLRGMYDEDDYNYRSGNTAAANREQQRRAHNGTKNGRPNPPSDSEHSNDSDYDMILPEDLDDHHHGKVNIYAKQGQKPTINRAAPPEPKKPSRFAFWSSPPPEKQSITLTNPSQKPSNRGLNTKNRSPLSSDDDSEDEATPFFGLGLSGSGGGGGGGGGFNHQHLHSIDKKSKSRKLAQNAAQRQHDLQEILPPYPEVRWNLDLYRDVPMIMVYHAWSKKEMIQNSAVLGEFSQYTTTSPAKDDENSDIDRSIRGKTNVSMPSGELANLFDLDPTTVLPYMTKLSTIATETHYVFIRNRQRYLFQAFHVSQHLYSYLESIIDFLTAKSDLHSYCLTFIHKLLDLIKCIKIELGLYQNQTTFLPNSQKLAPVCERRQAFESRFALRIRDIPREYVIQLGGFGGIIPITPDPHSTQSTTPPPHYYILAPYQHPTTEQPSSSSSSTSDEIQSLPISNYITSLIPPDIKRHLIEQKFIHVLPIINRAALLAVSPKQFHTFLVNSTQYFPPSLLFSVLFASICHVPTLHNPYCPCKVCCNVHSETTSTRQYSIMNSLFEFDTDLLDLPFFTYTDSIGSFGSFILQFPLKIAPNTYNNNSPNNNTHNPIVSGSFVTTNSNAIPPVRTNSSFFAPPRTRTASFIAGMNPSPGHFDPSLLQPRDFSLSTPQNQPTGSYPFDNSNQNRGDDPGHFSSFLDELIAASVNEHINDGSTDIVSPQEPQLSPLGPKQSPPGQLPSLPTTTVVYNDSSPSSQNISHDYNAAYLLSLLSHHLQHHSLILHYLQTTIFWTASRYRFLLHLFSLQSVTFTPMVHILHSLLIATLFDHHHGGGEVHEPETFPFAERHDLKLLPSRGGAHIDQQPSPRSNTNSLFGPTNETTPCSVPQHQQQHSLDPPTTPRIPTAFPRTNSHVLIHTAFVPGLPYAVAYKSLNKLIPLALGYFSLQQKHKIHGLNSLLHLPSLSLWENSQKRYDFIQKQRIHHFSSHHEDDDDEVVLNNTGLVRTLSRNSAKSDKSGRAANSAIFETKPSHSHDSSHHHDSTTQTNAIYYPTPQFPLLTRIHTTLYFYLKGRFNYNIAQTHLLFQQTFQTLTVLPPSTQHRTVMSALCSHPSFNVRKTLFGHPHVLVINPPPLSTKQLELRKQSEQIYLKTNRQLPPEAKPQISIVSPLVSQPIPANQRQYHPTGALQKGKNIPILSDVPKSTHTPVPVPLTTYDSTGLHQIQYFYNPTNEIAMLERSFGNSSVGRFFSSHPMYFAPLDYKTLQQSQNSLTIESKVGYGSHVTSKQIQDKTGGMYTGMCVTNPMMFVNKNNNNTNTNPFTLAGLGKILQPNNVGDTMMQSATTVEVNSRNTALTPHNVLLAHNHSTGILFHVFNTVYQPTTKDIRDLCIHTRCFQVQPQIQLCLILLSILRRLNEGVVQYLVETMGPSALFNMMDTIKPLVVDNDGMELVRSGRFHDPRAQTPDNDKKNEITNQELNQQRDPIVQDNLPSVRNDPATVLTTSHSSGVDSQLSVGSLDKAVSYAGNSQYTITFHNSEDKDGTAQQQHQFSSKTYSHLDSPPSQQVLDPPQPASLPGLTSLLLPQQQDLVENQSQPLPPQPEPLPPCIILDYIYGGDLCQEYKNLVPILEQHYKLKYGVDYRF